MSLITWKLKKSLHSMYTSPYLKVLIFLSIIIGAAVATCEVVDHLIINTSNLELNTTQNSSIVDASIYTTTVMLDSIVSLPLIIMCFMTCPIIHYLLFGDRWR
jgi:hypothetical protein